MVAESSPLISVNDYLTLERKSAERHELRAFPNSIAGQVG
jgi:hypothetical protein